MCYALHQAQQTLPNPSHKINTKLIDSDKIKARKLLEDIKKSIQRNQANEK